MGRGHSDAWGCGDDVISHAWIIGLLDPDASSASQIPAVQAAVNGEGFAQSSGTASQVDHRSRATLLNEFESLQRDHRSNEYGTRDTARFGDGVQAVPTMNRIHVQQPRSAEQRLSLP